MTQRSNTFEMLEEYFDKKGKILSAAEYQAETDTPVRFLLVRKIFGGWQRMEMLMRARKERVAVTDADDLIAAKNAEIVAALEAEAAEVAKQRAASTEKTAEELKAAEVEAAAAAEAKKVAEEAAAKAVEDARAAEASKLAAVVDAAKKAEEAKKAAAK